MKKEQIQNFQESMRFERIQATRALLMNPMLRARSHPDVFAKIKTHADWLRTWFAKNLNWSLYIDNEIARLGKTPAEPLNSTRPARDLAQNTPFTRFRYVLFCIILVCLEKSDHQVTLGGLSSEAALLISEDTELNACGISLELENREHRKDFVQTIHLLVEYGVLVRVDGNESEYVSKDADVLYTLNRQAISRVLNVNRGPSSFVDSQKNDRPSKLIEETLPDTEDGWNRHLRIKLMRRLVEEPIIYYTTLTREEKTYLDSQRHFLLKQINEATGLIAEVRAEGIAMVDEESELSDHFMPEEGTNGHFSLLIAEFFADHLRAYPNDPCPYIPLSKIEEEARRLKAKYQKHWRKSIAESGGERELIFDGLYRLSALNLIKIEHHSVLPLPAIARYRIETISPEEGELFS